MSGTSVRGVALIGRAAVSKTVGWGFESLHPCHRVETEPEDGRRKTEDEMQMMKDRKADYASSTAYRLPSTD